MTNDTIVVNLGSDVEVLMVWPDGDTDGASPKDLTGADVSIFDVTEALSDSVSASITTASAGEITISIAGNQEFSIGREMFFRVMVTQEGTRTTTPRYFLQVV